MRRRSLFSKMSWLLGLCLAVLTLGCGPGKKPGKTANVTAGSMPADAEWTGVYYSPLFGYLHLEGDGSLINGKWQRPRKGEWGTLKGNADGNLMRFDWEEYVDGLVGPNAKKSGKGYFVYIRPEGDNVDDQLKGEVGRGDDEVGIGWEAIKQRDVKPDLDSIGGSGSGDVGGGDWDSGNSEEGDPESPSEPEPDDEPTAPEL
jgi:hypothetical protein